ncbi:MAG: alpha/beta hydrolase [Syntrophomonadaceae bacterium]
MPDRYVLKKVSLIDGETIGYREAGTGGPLMVMLHGNMTSSKHMEILMERLEDRYKIYAPDMRGFGASTYNQRITSLKDLADDIKFWADSLGLKDFVLVGWSTGGGVAMQLAADNPDYVRKLVLIESVGIKGYRLLRSESSPIESPAIRKLGSRVSGWSLEHMKILNTYPNRDFVRQIWDKAMYNKNRPDDALYEEYLDDAMTQRNVADLHYALLRFNISTEHNGLEPGNGRVNLITAPTLVLQGDRDLVVPRFTGEEIATALGSEARLVILPDSGHSPLIDCMDELVERIEEFV